MKVLIFFLLIKVAATIASNGVFVAVSRNQTCYFYNRIN